MSSPPLTPAAEAHAAPAATTADGSQAVLDSVDTVNALRAEQEAFPLIGPLEAIEASLFAELHGNAALFASAQRLPAAGYTAVRRIRRDGSCFLRAAGFRMLERIVAAPILGTGDAASAAALGRRLAEMRAPMLARFGEYMEDFCDVARDVVLDIASGLVRSPAELLARVTAPGVSEYVVCFYRYAISHWMRSHADDYAPFLVDFASIEDYCAQEVECVGRECDHLHIKAFSDLFQLPIVVEVISASTSGEGGDGGQRHVFGPEDGSAGEPVTLLFRPGHYDLLYR